MDGYLNAGATPHMTKRRGSAPETHTLRPRACAVCSSSPCPPCSAGQMCQQVFRNKVDCTSCPSNICVADPNYVPSSGGGGKAGPIGGAVGGVVGALALALVLFWFYRAKKRREEQEAARRRVDAKLRAAEAEKFRPGGSKTNSISSASKRTRTPASPFVDEEDDAEAEEEDIEWTEMRPDGLTTFTRPPGSPGEETLHEETHLDVAGNLKRRSTGAATHLSRITEGAEEEEELRRRASIMSKMSAMPVQRNYGSTSSINLSSSGTLNPFSDSASVNTESSGHTKIIPIMFSGSRDAQGRPILSPAPTQPERALRAAGAPLIDLKGQPAQRQLTPAGGGGILRNSNGSMGKGNNYLPTSQSPLRAQRDPTELGYRSSTLGPNSSNDGQLARYITDDLSPAAPSTSASQHFDFRNMDPEEIAKLPEELRRSAVYARAAAAAGGGRPLSGQTVMSQASSSTDYAPQLVTPQTRSSDAAKRIVVSTAKASLVRSVSQKRRDAAAAGADPRASSRFSAINPFSDDATPTTLRDHSSGDDPYANYGHSTPSSTLTVHTYAGALPRPGSAETTGTFGEPGRVDSRISMPRSATADSMHDLRTGASQTSGSEWTQPSAPVGQRSTMMRPGSGGSGLSMGALPFTESSLAYAAQGDRASYWTDGSRDSSVLQARASTSASGALGNRPASNATSAARQSNASSIGGLSVLDGIPFVDPTDSNPLPSNAAASIAAARGGHALQAQQQQAHERDSRRMSDWVDESAMGSDEEWQLADDDVPVPSFAGAPARPHNASLPHSALGSSDSVGHRSKSSGAPSTKSKTPVATGATTDFEALRLQHELAQYPFAAYSPSALTDDQPGSPRD